MNELKIFCLCLIYVDHQSSKIVFSFFHCFYNQFSLLKECLRTGDLTRSQSFLPAVLSAC